MKINVDHITLHYEKSGKGNPILLLHGNGEDHKIYDELIYKLKIDYTLYAIDSRNHGESSITNDYTYESIAIDIYEFIEIMNLKDVTIIGFSDGAIISLLVALKDPKRLSKLILLGINLSPKDFKEDIYQSLINEYEKTKAPLIKMMLEQPNISLTRLKTINTPTLLVAGENDLFKEESFQDIIQNMPNASLKIIKGHDHSSYVIHEDILYPTIIKFLKK